MAFRKQIKFVGMGAVLCLILGWFVQHPSHESSVSSEVSGESLDQPTPRDEAISQNISDSLPTTPPAAPVSLDILLENERRFADKAVLTVDERDSLLSIYHDKTFQIRWKEILEGSKETQLHIPSEKSRVEALDLAKRMFERGDEETRVYLQTTLMTLMTNLDGILTKSDISLRKSLLGDRLEILRIAHAYDKDLFQDMVHELQKRDGKLQEYAIHYAQELL